MASISLQTLIAGNPNSTEDLKTRDNFTAIANWVSNPALTNGDIAAGANIDAGKLLSGSITSAKLSSTASAEAVATANIQAGAVTSAKIASTGGSEGVATVNIQAGAVTSAKLSSTVGSEAVATANIQDSAITSAKVANNNVLYTKLGSVPYAVARRNAALTISVSTYPSGSLITIPLDTSVSENDPDGGGMVDVVNGRVYVRRTGLYQLSGEVTLSGGTYTGGAMLAFIAHNTVSGGTTTTRIVAAGNQSGSWSGSEFTGSVNGTYYATAGDYFTLGFRHNQASGSFGVVVRGDVTSTTGVPNSWMTPMLRVSWLGKIANS